MKQLILNPYRGRRWQIQIFMNAHFASVHLFLMCQVVACLRPFILGSLGLACPFSEATKLACTPFWSLFNSASYLNVTSAESFLEDLNLTYIPSFLLPLCSFSFLYIPPPLYTPLTCIVFLQSTCLHDSTLYACMCVCMV